MMSSLSNGINAAQNQSGEKEFFMSSYLFHFLAYAGLKPIFEDFYLHNFYPITYFHIINQPSKLQLKTPEFCEFSYQHDPFFI